MQNWEKIEELRGKLNASLNPKFKEYVQAELDYAAEISCGYVVADMRKAELRLISAIKELLNNNAASD